MTRHLKADDLAVVERMTRSGHSAPQIAEQLGCTSRTVQRARVRLGIAQPAATAYPTDVWDMAQQMIQDGCSHKEVARTLGIAATTIGRRFPGTGWTKQQGAEWWGQVRRLAA